MSGNRVLGRTFGSKEEGVENGGKNKNPDSS
jgi:hypothetical protein